jgi:hypothetical protein
MLWTDWRFEGRKDETDGISGTNDDFGGTPRGVSKPTGARRVGRGKRDDIVLEFHLEGKGENLVRSEVVVEAAHVRKSLSTATAGTGPSLREEKMR